MNQLDEFIIKLVLDAESVYQSFQSNPLADNDYLFEETSFNCPHSIVERYILAQEGITPCNEDEENWVHENIASEWTLDLNTEDKVLLSMNEMRDRIAFFRHAYKCKNPCEEGVKKIEALPLKQEMKNVR